MLPSTSKTNLGFVKPELPTLVPEPPTGEGWIHEIKYDGYRTLIVIDRGQVRAFTRHGNDWTPAYRRVVDSCGKLACKAAVLDSEMVVQDEQGITDFNGLRSALHTAPHRIVFFAFDLLQLDRSDLPAIHSRSTPTYRGSSPVRAAPQPTEAALMGAVMTKRIWVQLLRHVDSRPRSTSGASFTVAALARPMARCWSRAA